MADEVQTDGKLRGMGCNADQRKRLMMASKLGLGPLKQLGLAPAEAPPSPPGSMRLRSPPPNSTALQRGSSRSAQAALLQHETKKRKMGEEDDLGLEDFLAAGKARKKAAPKVASGPPLGKQMELGKATTSVSLDRLREDAAPADANKPEEKRREREEDQRHRVREDRHRQQLEKNDRQNEDRDGSECDEEQKTRERNSSDSQVRQRTRGSERRPLRNGSSKGHVSKDIHSSDEDFDDQFDFRNVDISPDLTAEDEVLKLLRKSRKKNRGKEKRSRRRRVGQNIQNTFDD